MLHKLASSFSVISLLRWWDMAINWEGAVRVLHICSTKIKAVKISSGESGRISVKFCINENFINKKSQSSYQVRKKLTFASDVFGIYQNFFYLLCYELGSAYKFACTITTVLCYSSSCRHDEMVACSDCHCYFLCS